MNRPRALLAATLAAATLSSAGCVVAIGNRPERDDAGRIKLASDDAGRVPVVESALELPTFDEVHADALSRLTPDTTVEQFRQLFPDARFVERSSAYAEPVDAYSVVHKQTYRYDGERRYGYVKRDERWFYFGGGQFVKWGKPRDWPHASEPR
jgi:hypothetical protein